MSSSGYTDSGPAGGALRTTHEGDELMSREHKQLLREHRDTLVENMYPDEILNNLQARKILTARDVTRIKEKTSADTMNECLLDVLMRKPDRAFLEFVESLRASDQNHVANVLHKTATPVKRISTAGPSEEDEEAHFSSGRKRKATIGVRLTASEVEEEEEDDDYDDLVPRNPTKRSREEALTAKLNEEILETSLIELRNLKRIAKTGISPQNVNARRKIMKTLRDLQRFRREIIGIEEGSVVYFIYCPTLPALEDLWRLYVIGELKQIMQDTFITKNLLQKFKLKSASVSVHIDQEDYKTCWTFLAGQGCSLCAPVPVSEDDKQSPSIESALEYALKIPMEEDSGQSINTVAETPNRKYSQQDRQQLDKFKVAR